jgi:hypothetical protein
MILLKIARYTFYTTTSIYILAPFDLHKYGPLKWPDQTPGAF